MAQARDQLGDSRVADSLESLYLSAHETLQRPARNARADALRWLKVEVPNAFRVLRFEIALSCALFLGFTALGWLMVRGSEDLAGLFLDPRQMDKVRAGKVWTDNLFGVIPGAVLSFNIMLNNIIVSLFAFVVGCVYGLGTLYILATNGLMLGALLAFTYAHGVGERLLNFIPAHGVVELFIICVAAGCGLHVGDALIKPGSTTRAIAFRAAISRATPLLVFGAAGLVVCGLIEGYISPNPAVSFALRCGIGFGWFAIYLAVISGAVWPKHRLQK